MSARRIFLLLSRLVWLAVLTVSSLYCLLAYVPFTWHQVIQGKLIGSLSLFAEYQGWILAVAFLGCAVTLLPAFWIGGWSRLGALIFLVAAGVFCVFDLIVPQLPVRGNDGASLCWACGFLIPVLLLGVVDVIRYYHNVRWTTRPLPSDGRAFRACCFAAVFTVAVYSAVGSMAGWPLAGGLLASAAMCQLTVFLLGFAGVVAVCGAAAGAFYPARVEFMAFETLGALLLFLFLNAKVLPAMSFGGPAATLYAAGLAGSILLTFTGLSLAMRQGEAETVNSGLDLMLLPVTFAVPRKRAGFAVAIVLLAAAAGWVARTAAGFDWNYVLQQTAALLVWALAFSFFYSITRPSRRGHRILVLLPLALVALLIFREIPARAADMERYAGVNASFRLARDLLTPPEGNPSFYTLLNQSSNIGRNIRIEPVDLRIVPVVSPVAEKPNIFVIVIDSLRQDYVSAYNPRVTFTPAIGQFAQESAVFRRAFTHYGGTGLAEPSIWAGAMMVHKQYVTPFTPMNTLQKLVNGENYRSFVSMDNILDTVTSRTPNLTDLDAGRPTMDLDLCRSLSQLEDMIPPGEPVFAYTQPQNIHISVIAREGKTVPKGESYPGFYPPYASRLRRIDACFGGFISFLKARNLYDSSIVILTADHGDSLGEDGRFGHAYTLFPEIVKIPLIVHLPEAMRTRMVFEEDKPAFSTDISPTLYYLLGLKPTVNDPLFGRPLFTATRAEQQAYERPDYLLAASYAAVYGLLSDQGRRLYISDAVNEKDYLYNLMTGDAETIGIRQRNSSRGAIAGLIGMINQRFHFNPAQP